MNGYVQDERYTAGAGMRRSGAFQFCTVFDAGMRRSGVCQFCTVFDAGMRRSGVCQFCTIVVVFLFESGALGWVVSTRTRSSTSMCRSTLDIPVSYGPGPN